MMPQEHTAILNHINWVRRKYRNDEDSVQEAWLGAAQVMAGKNALGRIEGRAQDWWRQCQRWAIMDQAHAEWRDYIEDPPVWQSVYCEQLLNRISQRERMVIVLRYWQGMDNPEIARIMSVTQGRVSQIHMKALKLMRETGRNTEL